MEFEVDESVVEIPAGVLAAVLIFVFAFFGCVFACAACVEDMEFESDIELDDDVEFEPDIVFEPPAGVDCANAAPPSTKPSAIAGTIIFIGRIGPSLGKASLRRRRELCPLLRRCQAEKSLKTNI